MKIAFISFMRGFPWGGSEELWFKTAESALANGYEVATLTQRWDKIPDKIIRLRQTGARTLFYNVTRYTLFEKVAIKLRAKKWLADDMPEIQADVFIISCGSTWDFIEQDRLMNQIRSSGTPYVLISQHNFENGHIVGERQRGFAIDVVRDAAKFFFVARRNMQAAERQLGYLLNNVEVVSNPVNILNPSIKAFPESANLKMVCIARLDCDFKGQDILLQTLGAEEWKRRDFELKFFGSGPHEEHLRRLIVLYGLTGKVSVEGHVEDIDKVWETNQVLILPSLSEGTPLSLVEAMLSGRTAVATDVGDISRYVLEGKTGFLAATASVRCFKESLEQLWVNKTSLKAMGEAAFFHASSIIDFTPEERILHFVQNVSSSSPVEV